MAKIARSSVPLYQTRNRRVSWPVTLTNPDKSPVDLTGAVAEAHLTWSGFRKTLVTSQPLGADGKIRITGSASLTADMPLDQRSELQLSIVDSDGTPSDYVWPVIGEVP